jgi:membrane fusion protein, multidrug efflux system
MGLALRHGGVMAQEILRHERRRGWSKRLLRVVNLVAVCALAFGAYSIWSGSHKTVTAQQANAAVAVHTTTVQAKPIEITRIGLGAVTPWQMVNITPQVSGRIVQIPFREGRDVKEGEVLVRIDPRPFQAVLDQAKAKKDQDAANLANTEKNLDRDRTLLTKGGFATQQTVDNETAQVQVLKATIEGDQAAIEAAQLNLDFATITAPFPGVVSLRNIDIGNLVTPAAIIATVTQIEPIAVDFTLPQADLQDVQSAARAGTPEVLVYDQDGKNLLAKGQLEVINNQVDQASGTIKLKARFDNKDRKLWPGAFVQVAVVIRTDQEALGVPSEAVQHGPNGTYVWLISPRETANRQAVQIGEIQSGVTVITSGVKAGDRIVVTGQYSLTQGARITEANPAQLAQTQGE